jgi:hypothetical protein
MEFRRRMVDWMCFDQAAAGLEEDGGRGGGGAGVALKARRMADMRSWREMESRGKGPAARVLLKARRVARFQV